MRGWAGDATHPHDRRLPVEEVIAHTGFDLVIPTEVPRTRAPTPEELDCLRATLDPRQIALKEVPA